MSINDTVRLWKDPDHRGDHTLDHPAGEIALDPVVGGVSWPNTQATDTCAAGCMQTITHWVDCCPMSIILPF